jgi:L,D-transpeptidase-like protein
VPPEKALQLLGGEPVAAGPLGHALRNCGRTRMLPSALLTASASQPGLISELNLHGLLLCCVRFDTHQSPDEWQHALPACSLALTGRDLHPLDHSFSQPPVLVNLPEFKLRAMDDDYQVSLFKTVIIGKAYGHKSPVFEKEIKYVVFRPYWEVTPTIQRAEIVPHVVKDRNYIAKKDFEVITPDGKVVTDGPISDAVLAQLKSGKLHVRQKPGPTNSLGLVKLIFPNDDNVYLHGTEAPQLFSEEERDLSHGCIRVQKPADLAAWALRHNPGWNLERVNAAMNGTDNNVTVVLEKPIPVLILYGTVIVDEKNNTFFFADVYGYDKELDAALMKGFWHCYPRYTRSSRSDATHCRCWGSPPGQQTDHTQRSADRR